jgi:hypothetical protein
VIKGMNALGAAALTVDRFLELLTCSQALSCYEVIPPGELETSCEFSPTGVFAPLLG